MAFPSVQLELKTRYFEVTNAELLMIMYRTIESNIIILTNKILVARIHVLNLVFLF